jgi:hypothetical protein
LRQLRDSELIWVTCLPLLPSTRLSCKVQTRRLRKVVAHSREPREINTRNFLTVLVLVEALRPAPPVRLRVVTLSFYACSFRSSTFTSLASAASA